MEVMTIFWVGCFLLSEMLVDVCSELARNIGGHGPQIFVC